MLHDIYSSKKMQLSFASTSLISELSSLSLKREAG